MDWFRDHPGRFFLLAALLPLAASVVLFATAAIRKMLGGSCKIPNGGAYLVLGAMAMAATLCLNGLTMRIANLSQSNRWEESIDWISFGHLKSQTTSFTLGYRIDTLSAIMMAMVTVVGTLIVLFSLGYMHDEKNAMVEDHAIHHHRRGRFGRFFAYLGLFCFSMLSLLMADNLLQIFMSWELVGVCSFFLISFYTERKTATVAANKAFIVNRIGDAGFLIALFLAWNILGTFNTAAVFNFQNSYYGTLFGLCLFIGCMGKSAQIPLQTWLPDAMEGPTPVSALIHAATMVAAGVYLVGRCFAAFNETVLLTIAIIGAVTAFVSATIAIVQTDIKRVLAFSTCSQLGFMMLAMGIGAWSAALLHLLTHAFFKALLFLGSGSVIHACHHVQDLRQMGGLRKKLPITAYTMLIGVLAISGVPFLSGWASKDQIVSHLFGYVTIQGPTFGTLFIMVLPILTVALTAFYMMRLWLMAFAGVPRNHHVHDHAHESPWVMTIPLVILSAFSVAIAWGWPIWDADASYLGHLLESAGPKNEALSNAAHSMHIIAGVIALALAIIGISWAIIRHYSGAFQRESNAAGLRKFLDQRWYFDDLYDWLFTKSTLLLSKYVAMADKSKSDVGTPGTPYDLGTIDGMISAPATFVRSLGGGMQEANRGLPRGYVLAMALTLVAALGILSRYVK